MSDEQNDQENPPAEMSTEQPTALVRQVHGGAIKTGGFPRRLANPSTTDCADRARDVLYKIIPRYARIAMNTPKRPRGTKKGDKSVPLKKPYSIGNQIKAGAELRMIATMDRALRETQVMASLMATRDEILEFLPREQADALMAKIAPHWLGI